MVVMFYLNLEIKWLNLQVLAGVRDVWHFLHATQSYYALTRN